MSANKISKIKPASGYVFIEPTEQTAQTAGGIYLPDSAKGDKPQTGKVLAVTGAKAPAKKGDLVYYKKWGGNEVKVEGKEYLFVKFEDVLGTYGR
jgi:chaperonin GroES